VVFPLKEPGGYANPTTACATWRVDRRGSCDHPRARFVLAHCGARVFDRIWPRINDYPNVLFDTSWWNPATIAALLRLVPPSRILFGSDIPLARCWSPRISGYSRDTSSRRFYRFHLPLRQRTRSAPVGPAYLAAHAPAAGF
jgi:hypothetical protein